MRSNVLLAIALASLALATIGCDEHESSEPPSASDAPLADIPDPVAQVRATILSAAEAGDYEDLRPLVKPAVFLSDYGFGEDVPDPVARWHELGPEPLETMSGLLRMQHVVRETNEGTLYQWPRFDQNSSADDVSASERGAFLTFMTEEELANALLPEYGYTGPRLGILSDGTWWFFLSGGAP